MATWPQWNAGVERIDLHGPFAAGTTATMVLPGGESLAFRLAWVDFPDVIAALGKRAAQER